MLEFETQSGSMYAWDDEMGLFIPFSPTMKAVINEISNRELPLEKSIIERLGGDFEEEDISFCYGWIKKWEKIEHKNQNAPAHSVIPQEDIKNYLLKNGFSHLILSVTEDCNFRCKYCIYSDYYEYTRGYSKNYMEFSIAKKAIDLYFSLLRMGMRYNPLRRPQIGFYGGEPLLNFELIKKSVEYVERKYGYFKTCYYNLTTNGSLLDKEKADWLIQHNFSIAVSLDGPEEEHDRNRVYINGKGTFKDIMKNIRPIMNSGFKDIFSIAIFNWKTDLFNLEEFFNRDDVPSLLQTTPVNKIGGTKYYEQFSEEDRSAFIKRYEDAMRYYMEHLHSQSLQSIQERPSFLYNLFGYRARVTFTQPFSILSPCSIMPYTGGCVPGTKIFVSSDGNIYLCERVPEVNPFGNVKEGLNFEKIGQIVNDYIRHMDGCQSCKVKKHCTNCYADFMTDKGFLYSSEICQGVEQSSLEAFANVLAMAEINPEVIAPLDKSQENIKKYYGD